VAAALARALIVFEKHLRKDAREIWETLISGRTPSNADRLFGSNNLSATNVFQTIGGGDSGAPRYPHGGPHLTSRPLAPSPPQAPNP